MADIESVAKQFADFYYNAFDTNRAGLQALYRNTSMLSFEGIPFQGDIAITEKLVSLPFQAVKHSISTCDAQPFPNGIAVMITGQLIVDGQEHPLQFTQAFTLIGEGGSYYVLNDIFRLNYG